MSKNKIFLNGMTFVSEPVALFLPFGSRDSFLSDGFLADDEYLFGDVSFLGDFARGKAYFKGSELPVYVYQSIGGGGDSRFQFSFSSSFSVLKGVLFKDLYIKGQVIRNSFRDKNLYFSGLKLRLVSEFVPFFKPERSGIMSEGVGMLPLGMLPLGGGGNFS
ncbi:hypothetical protein [Tenacibaculum finnmarkense]|uniref:hypothetical protein n=1 Tax=Tenacibaculum finnmarkense TaxID=2781243 RepID=UPI001EFB52A7|nr:hypothetical protein [Tenacibaculum finnmarkense]MCG8746989.1 hypothetical protein [Tenacibaculum finnmarkense]